MPCNDYVDDDRMPLGDHVNSWKHRLNEQRYREQEHQTARDMSSDVEADLRQELDVVGGLDAGAHTYSPSTR